MEEEEPNKSLVVFGRDLAQIPCFRNTFLYSIGGGVFAGALTFLGTSRPRFSSHVGFTTFFCGTFCYWFYCRYQWSKQKFDSLQLKAAMKKHVLNEGTDAERELFKDA